MASMEIENKDTGRPVIDDVDPLLSSSSSAATSTSTSSSSRAPRRAPRSSPASSSSPPIAIDVDPSSSSSAPSITIDVDVASDRLSSSSSDTTTRTTATATATTSSSSSPHDSSSSSSSSLLSAWRACATFATACHRGCAELWLTNARDAVSMAGSVLFIGLLFLTPAYKIAIILMTFTIFFIGMRLCVLHVLPHMIAARDEVDGGTDGDEEEGDAAQRRRRRVRFRLGDLRRGRRRRRYGDGIDLDDWGMSRTHLRLSLRDGDFTANDYETLLRLDEEHNRMMFTGISQSLIERFPSYTVTSDVAKQCAICLENPEIGDKIRTIPCLHAFHAKCIDKWLRNKPTCPVCTFDVRIST